MGAARWAAALVRNRILRAGALSETAVCRGARCFTRHFARLHRGLAIRGAGPFDIGANTLGSD